MSKEWPLDDIRNERWAEFSGYLDDLLFELGEDEKSMLLTSLCRYENVSDLLERVVAAGGDPSFDSCSIYRSKEKVIRLFDCDIGVTPMGSAIMGFVIFGNNTLGNLKSLLSMGANVNQVAHSTYTPLQLTIVHDLPEYARLLLENGADPRVPSAEYDKPDAWDYSKGKSWALSLLREFHS